MHQTHSLVDYSHTTEAGILFNTTCQYGVHHGKSCRCVARGPILGPVAGKPPLPPQPSPSRAAAAAALPPPRRLRRPAAAAASAVSLLIRHGPGRAGPVQVATALVLLAKVFAAPPAAAAALWGGPALALDVAAPAAVTIAREIAVRSGRFGRRVFLPVAFDQCVLTSAFDQCV